jgi:hypothetical protein
MSTDKTPRSKSATPAPADEDTAFEVYWEGVLAACPALRTYRDDQRIRGLAFADFRASQSDAFRAGRASVL